MAVDFSGLKFHATTMLFYVISGHGRVAGADDAEVRIGPGSLVEWQSGEEHTSWAESEMTVLIIQNR